MAKILNNPGEVLLLYGEEEFLLEEFFRKITSEITSDESASFNFDVLDPDEREVNPDIITELCRSYPLMSEKRYVVVKRIENLFKGAKAKSKKYTENFRKYLESASPQTLLILTAGPAFSKDIVKFKSGKVKSIKFPFDIILEKHNSKEFKPIRESQFPEWISERVQKAGKKIEPRAAELLRSLVNPSLYEIDGEIQKLLLFCADKESITTGDVSRMSGQTREYNVFELQKSVAMRDLPASLKIMDKLLSGGRLEMLILATLSRFFISLWKYPEALAKSGGNRYQLAKLAGIPPFLTDEFAIAANKYSPADSSAAIITLTNYDLKLKSNYSDRKQLMTEMLILICSDKP